jgi:hypothetical protein
MYAYSLVSFIYLLHDKEKDLFQTQKRNEFCGLVGNYLFRNREV